MTEKEKILNQIEELEQRAKDDQKTLAELKLKVQEEEKGVEVSATGVYLKEPKKNALYYYVATANRTEKYYFDMEGDKKRLNLNNCFSTEEQAKQEALRREIQEFTRKYAMLNNKNHDWRKKNDKSQFSIFYNTNSNFLSSSNTYVTTSGEVFFDTEELCKKCIDELNKKYTNEQLKIGFGVI